MGVYYRRNAWPGLGGEKPTKCDKSPFVSEFANIKVKLFTPHFSATNTKMFSEDMQNQKLKFSECRTIKMKKRLIV